MRVLVVDDTEVMRQIVVTVLERQFKGTVVEAHSGNEAIEHLKKDQTFDCVVCDYAMPNGTGADVYHYMKTNGISIPYIFCSTENIEDCAEFKNQEIFGIVEKEKIVPSLTRLMNALKKNAEFQVGALTHCRVSMNVLQKLGTVNCDFYLKISAVKFIRVINKRDQIDEDVLAKYQKKGVDSLYVRHVDSMVLLDALVQYALTMSGLKKAPSSRDELVKASDEIKDKDIRSSILEIIKNMEEVDAKHLDLPDALKVGQEVQRKIERALRDIGVTAETETLIKANVLFTLQGIAKNSSLMELFKAAEFDGDRFLISHSTLLAYVACSLASIIGWNSDFTRYKLCLAAFLHDLSISHMSFSRLESLEELLLRTHEFSQSEVDMFLHHTVSGSAITLNLSDLPQDVDQIVLQHHERPDGTGFPNRLNSAKLGPLPSLFILAHDLVSYVFDSGAQKWAFRDFIIKSGATYEYGNFYKIKKQLLCTV